jgi:hypothetical protein
MRPVFTPSGSGSQITGYCSSFVNPINGASILTVSQYQHCAQTMTTSRVHMRKPHTLHASKPCSHQTPLLKIPVFIIYYLIRPMLIKDHTTFRDVALSQSLGTWLLYRKVIVIVIIIIVINIIIIIIRLLAAFRLFNTTMYDSPFFLFSVDFSALLE